ncbi:hypothetical protein HD806DRAFT_116942 [Xylariaceae sp. AK1471]|nr:hypothetical protein HD806DRAFT_116942 [Xylariaceae sp. AK1471]
MAILRKTIQFLSITPEAEMHHGHSYTSHLAQDQAPLGIDTYFAVSADLITRSCIWLQRTRTRLFMSLFILWEIPTRNPAPKRTSSTDMLGWVDPVAARSCTRTPGTSSPYLSTVNSRSTMTSFLLRITRGLSRDYWRALD